MTATPHHEPSSFDFGLLFTINNFLLLEEREPAAFVFSLGRIFRVQRRTPHARHAPANQRLVGSRSRDVPRRGRAGAGGSAQAMGADRRRHRDGRVCAYQRVLYRHVLLASGRPDAAHGVRGGLGEAARRASVKRRGGGGAGVTLPGSYIQGSIQPLSVDIYESAPRVNRSFCFLGRCRRRTGHKTAVDTRGGLIDGYTQGPPGC